MSVVDMQSARCTRINDFNEVRRVASHSSIYRQLSEDDLDCLDWLKGELYSRCEAAGIEIE